MNTAFLVGLPLVLEHCRNINPTFSCLSCDQFALLVSGEQEEGKGWNCEVLLEPDGPPG